VQELVVVFDVKPPSLIARLPGRAHLAGWVLDTGECSVIPADERDEEGREVACWHASDRDPLRAGDEHAPVV
jgi:hypothetical protein